MKISYHWLADYIDAPLPPAEAIADALTMHAFEVETIEKNGNDTLFEISVLPNRAHDCLSYIGIAREVATLLDLPLKLPEYVYEGDASVKTSDAVTLVPPDGKLVRRALKRLAIDVKVGESPDWLKERLIAQGQRPINNIVDATNFVMWETGQPVHAFDYDKLAGEGIKEISIRNAVAGEKVTTLDDKEFSLDENMLVIADKEKALDIAGVKGGNNSGIDASTKRVLLSACTFHPTSIRKTSRKLNLLTDASKRFEQEISPVLAERGMARLAALIADIAEAKVAADSVEFYPRKRNPYFVGVSTDEANALLGTSLSAQEIEHIFDRLGFNWKKVSPRENALRLAPTCIDVPYKYGASVSFDCPAFFDCGSFVNYLYAQGGIALPRMAQDQFVSTEPITEQEALPGDLVFSSTDSDGKTEYVETLGINQIRQTKQTIDYIPGVHLEQSVDHVGVYLGDGKVAHASPISDKGKVVVEELKDAPKFQKIVGFGRIPDADKDRYVVIPPPERLDLHAGPGFMISGNAADLVEEIGRVYGYENIAPRAPTYIPAPQVNKMFFYTHKIRDILVDLGFSEVMTYAFQGEGEVAVANPLVEDKKYLRSSLQAGLVDASGFNSSLLPLLGIYGQNSTDAYKKLKIFEIGTVFMGDSEFLQLGFFCLDISVIQKALSTIEDKIHITLHPQDFLLEGPFKSGVLINLTNDLSALTEPGSLDDLAPIEAVAHFKPISNYPFVLRDIAVWIPDGSKNDIEDVVRGEAGNMLARIDPFTDEPYRSEKEAKTSYAYHLVFQSQEKTLSDDEVNTIMARVTDALNSKEGFKVR
jgi:phenylalanyl-tRNA synthetase beta subunit